MEDFKRKPLDERKKLAEDIMKNNKDRVPVVIDKGSFSMLSPTPKNK